MMEEIWNFFKNPIYSPYLELTAKEKKTIFFRILTLTVAFSFILGIAMRIITSLVGADLGEHGMESILKKYSLFVIFLLAVVLAPLLEELLFRAPLALFENSRFFKIAFYTSALLFGAVHLNNFETFTDYFWLAPVLIAPQAAAGFFLGFVRVKLGLSWSILLHAAHNAILLSPVIFLKLFGEPIAL
jgi:hypothetical protein